MANQKTSLALATGALLVAIASLGCHSVDLDFTETDEIRLYDDLYSVSVADDKHAVAVGYYGAAYWTDDGGATWRRGLTGTFRSLYKVAMADAQHGFAVGQRGIILRTVDGGRTWEQQPNLKEDEETHLFAVDVIDKDSAVAVGAWGTRIRTTDGGETWVDDSFIVTEDHPLFVWLSPFDQERARKGEKVYEDVSLNDVSCLRGTKSCWLIGEFGYIFFSEDGGQSWEPSTIEGSVEMAPIEVGYNVIEVPDSAVPGLEDFAAVVGPETHLNVAIEAVASPREVEEFGDPEDPFELFEILEARCQDVRSVIEAAGVDSARVRLRGQPPWDYEDYLEDDPDVLNRYIEGRTAESPGMRLRVIQNPILFSIRFQNEDQGLIAGLGGVILVSDDGGRSWVYRKIDRKQALFSVAGTGQRSLAVGEKGLIRISDDGGSTWAEPSEGFPDIYTWMRDIGFDPRGRLGLIVGQTGRIYRSTDLGYTWTQTLPPAEERAAAG